MTLFLLSIWCVGCEFIDAVNSIRRLSVSIRWRFQGLQWFCFCRRFVDQPWQCFWQFHASAMTLVLLSIWCVGCEFSDAVDSILQLSVCIHWQFQGLQWLCFRWWFMDQKWHSVFDNSVRQPWLYFCYRFVASVVNSLMMSITYVGCHSVFIDDFKVYSDFVFAVDLWIGRDIAFLTIPCVSHDTSFAIDLMCWLWIHWRCRFHTTVVT